jgi:hypothetical protein
MNRPSDLVATDLLVGLEQLLSHCRAGQATLQAWGGSMDNATLGWWETHWWSSPNLRQAVPVIPHFDIPIFCNLDVSGVLPYQAEPVRFLITVTEQHPDAIDVSITWFGETNATTVLSWHVPESTHKNQCLAPRREVVKSRCLRNSIVARHLNRVWGEADQR